MSALPHNDDAERQVFGVYLLDPDTLLTSSLTASQFYVLHHQVGFAAMQGLSESGGVISPVTVVAEARRQGRVGFQKLEVAHLERLLADARTNFDAVAQVAALETLIRNAAERRGLYSELANAAGAVLDTSNDIDDVRDRVQSAMFRQSASGNLAYLEGGAGAASDALDFLQRVDSAQGGLLGLSTGISGLDSLTGGLQGGQLIVLGAATGGGKSTLALQLARHALFQLREPVPVYYASLEMSRTQCALKIASGVARVNVQGYRRRPNESDRSKLADALEDLRQRPFYCDDTPTMSLAQIRAHVLRAHHQTGGLGLVVVDYLQLMGGDGRRGDSRTVEVGRMANGLKALANELDVPIIALAQINRATQLRSNKRPTLADLRESGDIENAADVVMFLYSDAYYDPNADDPTATELLIRKNRFGEQGTVRLVAQLAYSSYAAEAVHV